MQGDYKNFVCPVCKTKHLGADNLAYHLLLAHTSDADRTSIIKRLATLYL